MGVFWEEVKKRKDIFAKVDVKKLYCKDNLSKTEEIEENCGTTVALSLFLCMPHRADFNNKSSSCCLVLTSCLPRPAASCGTWSSGSFQVAAEKEKSFQVTVSQPGETTILNNTQTAPFHWVNNSKSSSQPLELQIPRVPVVVRVGITLKTQGISMGNNSTIWEMVTGRGKKKNREGKNKPDFRMNWKKLAVD